MLALAYVLASFFGAGLAISEIARGAHVPVAAEAEEGKEPCACESASHAPSTCAETLVYSTVLRSTFQEWTEADGVDLYQSARFVPLVNDGEIVGVKVFAVRPMSALASLGIRNGDAIYAIEGTVLSSLDQAVAVYDEIMSREVSSIRLEMARKGCPMTILITLL